MGATRRIPGCAPDNVYFVAVTVAGILWGFIAESGVAMEY